MEELSLRQTRLIKEISKETMAEAVGVHVNTYSSYEDAPEKIPVGKAVLISQKLDVPFTRFISWAETKQNV